GSDTSFEFRSLISKWPVEMPYIPTPRFTLHPTLKKGVIEVIGSNVESLLQLAFFGSVGIPQYDSLYNEISKNVIFLNKDSSKFKDNYFR
ncbi:hypothetical protein NL317_28940, partial [Klebsiella pneumoniae]|nr:hypothetical protein [Klebsiella pneumoniae]